jgi:hypothetical protein
MLRERFILTVSRNFRNTIDAQEDDLAAKQLNKNEIPFIIADELSSIA